MNHRHRRVEFGEEDMMSVKLLATCRSTRQLGPNSSSMSSCGGKASCKPSSINSCPAKLRSGVEASCDESTVTSRSNSKDESRPRSPEPVTVAGTVGVFSCSSEMAPATTLAADCQ